MKRVEQDVAGRPPGVAKPRACAIRRTADSKSPSTIEVASFLDRTPRQSLLDDFAEFLGIDELDGDPDGHVSRVRSPEADPIFRERLRKQLWRVHQMAQVKRGSEPH